MVYVCIFIIMYAYMYMYWDKLKSILRGLNEVIISVNIITTLFFFLKMTWKVFHKSSNECWQLHKNEVKVTIILLRQLVDCESKFFDVVLFLFIYLFVYFECIHVKVKVVVKKMFSENWIVIIIKKWKECKCMYKLYEYNKSQVDA